jgi:hypothetical protein
METYVKTVDQSQSVDGMISFNNQTGGFELLSIESSEPLHIRFRVREKRGPTTALGNILVKDGQPPTVGTFRLRALPPGVVLENVTMDAARRKKVIDGVNADLKEYYVDPAAAQKCSVSCFGIGARLDSPRRRRCSATYSLRSASSGSAVALRRTGPTIASIAAAASTSAAAQ